MFCVTIIAAVAATAMAVFPLRIALVGPVNDVWSQMEKIGTEIGLSVHRPSA